MQMLFIINRVWLNDLNKDPSDSECPITESQPGSNGVHSFRPTRIFALLFIPTFLHCNSIVSDGGKEDERIFLCEPPNGYVIDLSPHLTE